MTHPMDRADPESINETTRGAVAADRAHLAAAERVALPRRESPRGRLERGWRWLRNRQSGPLPRLQRVGSVLRSTAAERRPFRELPDALLTALLAPVRISAKPSPPSPPRDWAPERTAAAARLAAAAVRIAGLKPKDLRLALIADADDMVALEAAFRVVAIRPDDWATVLETAETGGELPELLVVTSAIDGNQGAWANRIVWTPHPDFFLQRDLRALVAWFAVRDRPSIFISREAGSHAIRRWADAASLFDVVLALDDTTVAAYTAVPDRRGIGALPSKAGASVDAVLLAAAETGFGTAA